MASIGISDHALVRWLGRSGAMDIEQMRDWLAASLERAAIAADKMGGGRFLILADGMVFVVENSTVITVFEDDGRHAKMLSRPVERDHG